MKLQRHHHTSHRKRPRKMPRWFCKTQTPSTTIRDSMSPVPVQKFGPTNTASECKEAMALQRKRTVSTSTHQYHDTKETRRTEKNKTKRNKKTRADDSVLWCFRSGSIVRGYYAIPSILCDVPTAPCHVQRCSYRRTPIPMRTKSQWE